MGRQTNLDFDHAKLTFRYFVVTPLTLLELPEISAIWKLSMNLHLHAFFPDCHMYFQLSQSFCLNLSSLLPCLMVQIDLTTLEINIFLIKTGFTERYHLFIFFPY